MGPTLRQAPPRVHALFVAGIECVALLLIVQPWLRLDQRWRDLADAPSHLIRLHVVAAALERGEWFPRWLPELYLGYGYPLLNFYSPATYYLGAALHRLGLALYASPQGPGVVGVALGVGGAFGLARALYGGRVDAALVASLVYVLAPYPFITNLSIRAAVPEVLALGLLPWLLWAGLSAVRRGGPWLMALAAL